ncbi:hypothetical protein [Lysinibacillus sp.]|uniref:hypothetical protein n=1 Tax=Lysinibacillus sp. TaxID=1869345 RepID=UPI00289D4A76|nr:hypothetical protein [Lysinibacillus sp.]
MKPKFEVNQRVWVSVRNTVEQSKPYITEHIITRIEKGGIYARPVNHLYERRFHTNTLTNKHKNSKYEFKLWASVEDFWKAVEEGMYGGKS